MLDCFAAFLHPEMKNEVLILGLHQVGAETANRQSICVPFRDALCLPPFACRLT